MKTITVTDDELTMLSLMVRHFEKHPSTCLFDVDAQWPVVCALREKVEKAKGEPAVEPLALPALHVDRDFGGDLLGMPSVYEPPQYSDDYECPTCCSAVCHCTEQEAELQRVMAEEGPLEEV